MPAPGITMQAPAALPRFRYDQLMRLAWEGMIPTALFVLLVTSFVVFMGWMHLMWLASLIMVIVIWLVRPMLPRQADPNRRLPLLGSRFSPKTHEALLSSPVEPRGVD